MSTAEIDEITSKAETKNTKDNIKWPILCIFAVRDRSSFRTKDVKMSQA